MNTIWWYRTNKLAVGGLYGRSEKLARLEDRPSARCERAGLIELHKKLYL